MKKFFISSLLILAGVFCATAQDQNETPTCLVYGTQVLDTSGAVFDVIELVQVNPDLPPSRINKIKAAKALVGPYFYYGEAVCGGSYKMPLMTVRGSRVVGISHPGLTGGSGFDFKAPAKPCVYFLGAKSWEGDLPDAKFFEDTYVNYKGLMIGKPTWEEFVEKVAKDRILAVKKLQSLYKDTKWAEPLKEEMTKAIAAYEKSTGAKYEDK